MVCYANSSDGMELCCVEKDLFHVRIVIFIESQYNDSHASGRTVIALPGLVCHSWHFTIQTKLYSLCREAYEQKLMCFYCDWSHHRLRDLILVSCFLLLKMLKNPTHRGFSLNRLSCPLSCKSLAYPCAGNSRASSFQV